MATCSGSNASRASVPYRTLPYRGDATFVELKQLCSLTDGNLSRHLQILAEAGLVQIWKGTKDNRPQTLVQLTTAGRQRFLEYISVLENVVSDAVEAAKKPAAEKLAPGWTVP